MALPTLADVARQAGVSTFTASLALRHSPRVAAATRERVLAAADQLAYRPNPLVKTLMAGVRLRHRQPTGDVLAFLISREQALHPGQLDFQQRLQKGAAARALEHGFRLESFRLSSVHRSGRRMQQVLDTRHIFGVIIPPVPSRQFRLELAWDRLATVTLAHSFHEIPAHRVSSNHFRLMRTALDACRERGWTRPGLVLSQRLVDAVDDTLIGGYLAGTYLHANELPPPPLLYPDDRLDPAQLDRWIRQNKVDVVLALRQDMPEILASTNRQVGVDIGLALLDCPGPTGRFAGIDQRMQDLGATAVDLLVQAMQANEFGVPPLPRFVELDGVWVDGPTLPPRSALPTATAGKGGKASSKSVPGTRKQTKTAAAPAKGKSVKRRARVS